MNEDEALYQLERRRWLEAEQEEPMRTRRGNERMAYALDGLNTNRGGGV